MERSFLLTLLIVFVIIAMGFAQNPDWLYQGVSGKATWIGGPSAAIMIGFLFLIAILGGLHYLRNRTKAKEI